MLTNLQKSRIKYHLNITYRTAYEELEADFRLQLNNINPERELAIVGNQTNLNYSFQGQPLCESGSLLHRIEVAYSRISPDVIDTTLFVKATEEITLNPNELRLRLRLYHQLVDQLKQHFDLPEVNQLNYLSN